MIKRAESAAVIVKLGKGHAGKLRGMGNRFGNRTSGRVPQEQSHVRDDDTVKMALLFDTNKDRIRWIMELFQMNPSICLRFREP